MFVWMISSELQNTLVPNLVWQWRNFVCYLWSQGDQSMALSTVSSELLILWQPNLILWYTITSQSVLWKKKKKKKDYCIQGHGGSECSKCWCLSRKYLLNHWTFYQQTWYGDAYHERKCLSKWLVCSLQGQVKDAMIKIWLSYVSSELLILWLLSLVRWYIIISWIVVWKDWIALQWSRSG